MTPGLRALLTDFDVPIDRRRYFAIGAIGVLVKYGLDAAIVYSASGAFHSPLSFLRPVVGLDPRYPDTLPPWASGALVAVAIVFFFIGLCATVRRAIDAGRSPFWGFLFGVAIVRAIAIPVLCLLPSRPHARGDRVRDASSSARDTAIAIGGATVVGIVATALIAQGLELYGFALFTVTPLAMGGIAGAMHNRGEIKSIGSTLGVVLAALLSTGLLLMTLALEGALCIVMAAPLAIGMASLAALIARSAMAQRASPARAPTVLGLALLPVLALGEGLVVETPIREVRTHVFVDAPPERVWPQVIGFPDLPRPSELVRMSGLAYPVRARIIGTGVGAVRHCEFSTGPFVEPITRWEPPHRLSFDVTSQPMPMVETSPYGVIHPPHLDAMMRSRRGEFRLVALADGRTRLEGSTFYTLAAEPSWYWQPMADAIVHDIHERVLTHVAALAERP